jgi:hypothetical protein
MGDDKEIGSPSVSFLRCANGVLVGDLLPLGQEGKWWEGARRGGSRL